jgi:REP element-mobilizing transposase RayT
MSRALRIVYKNAVYHITSRGNGKQNIFLSDGDREFFLNLLIKTIKRYGWLCHSYCLMNNHYHLIIETPLANLSVGMRQLNGVFAQYFNRIHNTVGHLFQGRFKAIIVEKDIHLLELYRYIALNPVKANLVKKPHQYKWSSYPYLIKPDKREYFFTVDWILSQFGKTNSSAIKNLINFVNAGIDDIPFDRVKGQIYFGSDEFITSLNREKNITPEIPRVQKQPLRPALSDLLKNSEGMLLSYREYGYRMSEIANYLGVHYSTISRRLKRLEKREELLYCKI